MPVQTPPARSRSEEVWLLVILMVGAMVYFWCSTPPHIPWTAHSPPDFYGLETEALRNGRLYLDVKPAPELLALPDPYDPSRNYPWRVLDLSLYHGRYYLYFGLAPVIVLMLPWLLLTGTYLTPECVVAVGSTLGLAASLALLGVLRRRHFPGAPLRSVVLGGAILAFGNLVPSLHLELLYARIPQTWACAFTMWGLWAVAQSIGKGGRQARWWVLASLCCGLAVASRPSYLFVSLMLLPPLVVLARRDSLAPTGIPAAGKIRLLAAATVPLSLVIAAVLVHNRLRFGSFLEFGQRYQLIGERLLDRSVFVPSLLPAHLAAYLFLVPPLTRYFPFLLNGLEPMGILILLPFSWLVLGCVRWRACGDADGLRIFLASLGLAFLGNALLVLTYYTAWARYEIDALTLWMLGAVLGWLALEEAAARNSPANARRSVGILRLIGWGGACLAALTVASSLAYTARVFVRKDRLTGIARIFDTPAYALERILGKQPGALRLRIRLPSDRTGHEEPLVCTGIEGTDSLRVRYVSNHSVAFAFLSSAWGEVRGPEVDLDFGRPHEVEILLGSMCPPPDHPLYRGWTQDAVARIGRSVRVLCDGRTVLNRQTYFAESTPETLRIGHDARANDAVDHAFSGTILGAARLPLSKPDSPAYPAPGSGVVEMMLHFPVWKEALSAPLISTGRPGAGDLLHLIYLPDHTVQFAHDHWSAGESRSQPIRCDTTLPHRLVVEMPPLAGSKIRSGSVELGRLRVVLDGTVVMDEERPFFGCPPEEIAFGLNACRASTAEPVLTTEITHVRGLSQQECSAIPPALWSALPQWGDVDLEVRIPAGRIGTSEPLIATGVLGAADFVYLRTTDVRHIQIGYDHWNEGGPLSAPIPIDRAGLQKIRIVLPSLHRSTSGSRATVWVNGRVVLDVPAACYPATLDQIHIAANPIGGSTCGSVFVGTLVSVSRP